MNIHRFLQQALLEDLGNPTEIDHPGDHTSLACIPGNVQSRARLLVKADGVLAGAELARKIFHAVDPAIHFQSILDDGSQIREGDVAFTIEGEVKSILLGERLALNFMQRMSGIATLTNKFVQQTKGTKARILDTRKTTPTLRYFEKWAVRIGGGSNHRFGLYDMVMIKDNHIDFCGGIEKAIRNTKAYLEKNGIDIPVEVETRSLDDVRKVIDTGHVHRIMLDNFTPETVAEAVKLIEGRYETEASGGIDLSTIRPYAESGVDFISVGALTHSYHSLDLSLKAF